MTIQEKAKNDSYNGYNGFIPVSLIECIADWLKHPEWSQWMVYWNENEKKYMHFSV